MYEIVPSGKFKKDLKAAIKRVCYTMAWQYHKAVGGCLFCRNDFREGIPKRRNFYGKLYEGETWLCI